MDDKFFDDAVKQLSDLQQRRGEIVTELNSLDTRISSLYAFVEATATIPPVIIPPGDGLQVFEPVHVPPSRPPRGKKVIAILTALKEAYPKALSLDEIINEASNRGQKLIRESLRSQLSKLVTKGRVRNVRGRYLYISGLD